MQTKEQVYNMSYREWVEKFSEAVNVPITYNGIECNIEEAAHKYALDDVLWWQRRNSGPLVINCCRNFARALGEGTFNWVYPSTIYFDDIAFPEKRTQKDPFIFPFQVINYCPFCGSAISPISEEEFYQNYQWENIFRIPY